jgi:hypothetical protein
MRLKLRSEGTRINSEIYAESLAGTEGSAKAERVITLGEVAPGYLQKTLALHERGVGSRIRLGLSSAL